MRRIFISYARPDRALSESIAKQLMAKGLEVWIDKSDIKPSGGILKGIESGLRSSKFALIVCSINYFKSKWAQIELEAIVNYYTKGKIKRIFPILEGMAPRELTRKSPILSGFFAVDSRESARRIAESVELAVRQNRRPQHKFIPFCGKWYGIHMTRHPDTGKLVVSRHCYSLSINAKGVVSGVLRDTISGKTYACALTGTASSLRILIEDKSVSDSLYKMEVYYAPFNPTLKELRGHIVGYGFDNQLFVSRIVMKRVPPTLRDLAVWSQVRPPYCHI